MAYNLVVSEKPNLLTTKLYLPQARPPRLPRPRLVARLTAGLDGKLTLVSAPAGFGKTSLVADWLACDPQPDGWMACWLSLDEQDDDPARFWRYVVAALQTAVPGVGRPFLAQLQASPAAVPLTTLLNEIASLPAHPRLVLVLDDYHLIADPAIHNDLAFLVDHQPGQLHLVLLTRADPPLPLARLRARREMLELRQAELRFSPAEVAALCNEELALALAPAEIEILARRTEGWVAGLQLAALSLQEQADRSAFIRAFDGSDYFVLEYLAAEVLDRQPAAVRRFLLETSILDRLSAGLCDAVVGQGNSAELLAELQRRNLFLVPLDGSRNWFRYHHLFADLLRSQLARHYPAAGVQALQERAAAWHAAQADWEAAVAYGLAAGAYETAADWLAELLPELAVQGQARRILKWLAALPETVLAQRPELQIRQGWALFITGQMGAAEEVCLQARRRLPAGSPLHGELATVLATIATTRHDMAAVKAYASEALDRLPPSAAASRARALSALGLALGLPGDTGKLIELNLQAAAEARRAGNPFLAAHALEVVASGYLHAGRLTEAAATNRQIIELGEIGSGHYLPFAGVGYLGLAEVALMGCELAEAAAHLETGIAQCQVGGIAYALPSAHCIRAMVQAAGGEADLAESSLQHAESLLLGFPYLGAAVALAEARTRFHLARREIGAAAPWAAGRRPLMLERITPDRLPLVFREVQELSLARLWLAEGRLDEAMTQVDRVLETAEPAERLARVVDGLLLKALAHEEAGDRDAAGGLAGRLVAAGARTGLLWPVVAGGPAALDLLMSLDPPDGPAREYWRAVLAALAGGDAALAGLSGPFEPLTERELAVLGLIAAGLSNRQIAAELTVTLNTVKKHTSNLYSKLGARGRTQAVARGRELGLL